jgi:hypothetical protein
MSKSKRGGRRPGAGRKPPDPALVARVLELAAEGLTARQVADHPDVKGRRSLRAVYADIERQKGAVAERRPVP